MMIKSSDRAIYLALHRINSPVPFTTFYASLHSAKSFIAHELEDSVSKPNYAMVMANAHLNKILNPDDVYGVMIDLGKDYTLFIGIPDEVNLS